MDAERQDYLRNKEELQRLQKLSCQQNKELMEKEFENQMKEKLEKIEVKQQNSINAYQRTLNQKIKMAKDTNSRMEAVAQRAKQQQMQKLEI